MKVKVAKTAGFCMGVKNAVDKALSAVHSSGTTVYTLGPLIHNKRVVQALSQRGVKVEAEPPEEGGGKVVIRAHGTTEEKRKELERKGFEIVEGTCPHVLHSQKLTAEWSEKGYFVLIVGDKEHAEVAGLIGHCKNGYIVVSNLEELDGAELPEKVCVVAQTTFNEELYRRISRRVRELRPEATVLPSICRATSERQAEVLKLCEEVEAVVVVGDRGSANTRRLFEIALSADKPAFLVEGADELDKEALSEFSVVGVTAGASTPNWIIGSVVEELERLGRKGSSHALRTILKGAIRSNVYTALGASALCYCAYALFSPDEVLSSVGEYLFLAFAYIFSVYSLHRLLEARRGERFTQRARFSEKYRIAVGIISLGLLGGSMAVAWILNWKVLLLLISAYAMALVYSLEVVPRRVRSKYRKLKDLPASKDLFTAAGWTTVCVLIPFLHEGGNTPAMVVAGLVAFVMNFIRATAYDFMDIQGDHLLGRETLPVLLGERATRRLLERLSGGLMVVLLVGGGSGIVGASWSLALLLALCPLYMYLYLSVGLRWIASSEVKCSLVADGSLLLSGTIAFVWTLMR